MECDQTGKPCYLMEVQLLHENLLAWEVYHQARLEGVGPLVLELRQLELDNHERERLAYKLDVIGTVYSQITNEKLDAARKRRELEARTGRS